MIDVEINERGSPDASSASRVPFKVDTVASIAFGRDGSAQDTHRQAGGRIARDVLRRYAATR